MSIAYTQAYLNNDNSDANSRHKRITQSDKKLWRDTFKKRTNGLYKLLDINIIDYWLSWKYLKKSLWLVR